MNIGYTIRLELEGPLIVGHDLISYLDIFNQLVLILFEQNICPSTEATMFFFDNYADSHVYCNSIGNHSCLFILNNESFDHESQVLWWLIFQSKYLICQSLLHILQGFFKIYLKRMFFSLNLKDDRNDVLIIIDFAYLVVSFLSF
jgi:hypothetical protein